MKEIGRLREAPEHLWSARIRIIALRAEGRTEIIIIIIIQVWSIPEIRTTLQQIVEIVLWCDDSCGCHGV